MRKKPKQYPIVTITNHNDVKWSLTIHWNKWDSLYFLADTKTLVLRKLRKEMKNQYKYMKQDVMWDKEKLERGKFIFNEFLKVYNKKEFGAVYQIEEK